MPAPSWAKPGVMVVCVCDVWDSMGPEQRGVLVCPVEKIVHTIRDVRGSLCGRPISCSLFDETFLTFEELRNDPTHCGACGVSGVEPAFGCSQFRPVRTTNIEDLVSLTRPTHDQVYDELKKQVRRDHEETVR